MRELRHAVTHWQLFRHAKLFQRFTLEGIRVKAFKVRHHVKLHVDEGACQILGRIEALAGIGGTLDLVDQLLRDWLARVDVKRIILQHFARRQPVLVHLARELHIVARHGSTGERRIGHIGIETVQRVAEFVEQRRGIIP